MPFLQELISNFLLPCKIFPQFDLGMKPSPSLNIFALICPPYNKTLTPQNQVQKSATFHPGKRPRIRGIRTSEHAQKHREIEQRDPPLETPLK